MRSETGKRLALGAFAAVTALIAIFLLRDTSAFVNSPEDELFGHAGASSCLTVAAACALLVALSKQPSLLIVLVLSATTTVAAELAQWLMPDRRIELSDIAAGFSGEQRRASSANHAPFTATLPQNNPQPPRGATAFSWQY
jgi:hypothetical protein